MGRRIQIAVLSLESFPTHIGFTKSKNPKYVKINYQNIYNGKMMHFSRAVLIGNMHSYIKENLVINSSITSPIDLGRDLIEEIEIYTVINHDTISRRKLKNSGEYHILWKPPEEG